MRLIIHEHPGPFERFDVGAFRGNEGRTIRLTLQNGEVTHAQIVSAEVVECGGVDVTLEVAPWN
jgi:hypothetical protein